jgi:hypothetical protein
MARPESIFGDSATSATRQSIVGAVLDALENTRPDI